MIGELFRRLKYYFHRRQFEADLNEEMQHHLALKNLNAGSGAQQQFGNVTLLKEDSRAMWAWTFWEQLAQDLRYALRTMAGNRAFTALVVFSLALGIGANTAIFSFMDSILLRSLPVRDPERLALLNWHAKAVKSGGFVLHGISGSTYEEDGSTSSGIFPYPAFELFKSNDAAFSTLFAYRPARDLNVSVKGQAYLVNGEYVSGDYFRGLDVPPAAGRLVIADDDRFGAPSVVVLTYAFSQRSFGGPENATGQTVLLNNLPFLVVGVTPPGFFGVDPGAAPEIYLPFHSDVVVGSGSQFGPKPEGYLDKNYYWVEMMGRMKPGVTLAQAQATLAPNFANWVATTATTNGEADESSVASHETRRRGTGEPAPAVFQAAVCTDDDGGINSRDRVRERRKPVAGARGGAKKGNRAAAERGRGTDARRAAVVDGERPAGVDWRSAGSVVRGLGDEGADGAAREWQSEFHVAR